MAHRNGGMTMAEPWLTPTQARRRRRERARRRRLDAAAWADSAPPIAAAADAYTSEQKGADAARWRADDMADSDMEDRRRCIATAFANA